MMQLHMFRFYKAHGDGATLLTTSVVNDIMRFTQFNAYDGSAYEIAMEQMVELKTISPGVAQVDVTWYQIN